VHNPGDFPHRNKRRSIELRFSAILVPFLACVKVAEIKGLYHCPTVRTGEMIADVLKIFSLFRPNGMHPARKLRRGNLPESSKKETARQRSASKKNHVPHPFLDPGQFPPLSVP
jgi:hypothetical protein